MVCNPIKKKCKQNKYQVTRMKILSFHTFHTWAMKKSINKMYFKRVVKCISLNKYWNHLNHLIHSMLLIWRIFYWRMFPRTIERFTLKKLHKYNIFGFGLFGITRGVEKEKVKMSIKDILLNSKCELKSFFLLKVLRDGTFCSRNIWYFIIVLLAEGKEPVTKYNNVLLNIYFFTIVTQTQIYTYTHIHRKVCSFNNSYGNGK